MLQSFTDLIYENNNALTTSTCEDIIQRFRHDDRKSPGITTSGEVMPELKKSIDLAISDLDEWEDIDRTLFQSLAENLEEYSKQILEFNPKAFVLEQACPAFVPIIETGQFNSAEIRKVANEYLKPLLQS